MNERFGVSGGGLPAQVVDLGAAGLCATVVGALVLFGYALSEVAAQPGLSLGDAYSIGRLPWTAIGVDSIVIGSTVAVVFGTVAVLVRGPALRRLVGLAGVAVAAFWWFIAILPQPGGAPCPSCAPPGPDPLAFAYSLPQSTLLLLVLPATIVGALALTGSGTRRMSLADFAMGAVIGIFAIVAALAVYWTIELGVV